MIKSAYKRLLLISIGTVLVLLSIGVGIGYMIFGRSSSKKSAANDEAAKNVSNVGVRNVLPETNVEYFCRFELCGHEIKLDCDKIAPGMCEADVKNAYPECTIAAFGANNVLLKRTINSYCPDHFVVMFEKNKLRVSKMSLETLRLETLMELPVDEESLAVEELERLKQGITFDTLEEIDAYFECLES